MKKTLFTWIAMMVMGAVASVNAAYYVAGDFNGWNAAGNLMTETSSGIWSVSLSGIDPGRHEFKITNGDWLWSYPGANSWFYADASGTITITFNTNAVSDGWLPSQYRLAVSTDPDTWTLTGDFNNWDNTNTTNQMFFDNGSYSLTMELPPGTYQYKPVVIGTWDSISIDGRSINTANMSITTTELEAVKFSVDVNKGVVKTEVVSKPATVYVITPNGGERYLGGRIVEIEYTSFGEMPSVNIEYSEDNGFSWVSIESGVLNTGSYEWTVPDVDSENCLVRVASANNPTIFDTSDNAFIMYRCLKNSSDINNDCFVNLEDLALLAQSWLWCGDKYNPVCQLN
ncbi:MAG: hypothetical protein FJ263_05620 [Planctomycetes bacterium]|nr:hypothetical protein [Planctomycetota bacterium]